ncbi:unnamed protein product [Cochlearia groenlandica]
MESVQKYCNCDCDHVDIPLQRAARGVPSRVAKYFDCILLNPGTWCPLGGSREPIQHHMYLSLLSTIHP